MSLTRVAVLRGGPSGEYEVSLRTGNEVLRLLPEKYQPLDVYISRDGVWHMHGVSRPPEEVIKHVDVVFNALHGAYGEDGKVQKMLHEHHVPYTGSDSLSSAIAMNKVLAKRELWKQGIKTPIYSTVSRDQDIDKRVMGIFRMISLPMIVKPVDSGSSLSITLALDFEGLLQGVHRALEVSETAIIEEYIKGREATCGVIDHFRGQQTYALLPVEIIPEKSAFFDFFEKYSGKSREICPGNFSNDEKRMIQTVASQVHQALKLRHYSRSDFIVHPKRGVYFLEVNTLPGLTSESLFPKSLRAVGSNVPEFLDHVLVQALDQK